MRKKRIFYHSDSATIKSGFGRITKCLLNYLYKTGKYEIVNFACHVQQNAHDILERTPWKSIGCFPTDSQEAQRYVDTFPPEQRPEKIRDCWYGASRLDAEIANFKPDCYFGVQDPWGVWFAIDRPWFKQINSVLWTTPDSLPLWKPATERANDIRNFWCWSSFATEEFHRLGFKHVRTVHGPLQADNFYRFPKEQKLQLRKRFGIDEDEFIIGFVFRNQGRKLVPNLIEALALWKKENPKLKAKLLLHTNFSEVWNIPDLAKHYGVPISDILTTYICRHCKHYKVNPFIGEPAVCPNCGGKEFFTTGLTAGITETELNTIYNVMDVYCHPFNSGGQEIPIQEAKFAELITLVTNYSCGAEMCAPEAHSLPLEWESYLETQTQFVKATTKPSSIVEQLKKVYNMPESERAFWGIKAREWAMENYEITNIGPLFEEFIDSSPFVDWDSVILEPSKDIKSPNAVVSNNSNDLLWVKELYKSILNMDVKDDDSGLLSWLEGLKRGNSRQAVESYFRQEAVKQNAKNNVKELGLEDFLDKDDQGKRMVYVMPESLGDVFMSTCLLEGLKKQYPNYNLYFCTKPENFAILANNPYIHKVIPYHPSMNNLLFLEGVGSHKGFFELAFLPHLQTQANLSYLHNGLTNIEFDIKS